MVEIRMMTVIRIPFKGKPLPVSIHPPVFGADVFFRENAIYRVFVIPANVKKIRIFPNHWIAYCMLYLKKWGVGYWLTRYRCSHCGACIPVTNLIAHRQSWLDRQLGRFETQGFWCPRCGDPWTKCERIPPEVYWR